MGRGGEGGEGDGYFACAVFDKGVVWCVLCWGFGGAVLALSLIVLVWLCSTQLA